MTSGDNKSSVKAAVRETYRPNCNRGKVCGLLRQHRMLRPKRRAHLGRARLLGGGARRGARRRRPGARLRQPAGDRRAAAGRDGARPRGAAAASTAFLAARAGRRDRQRDRRRHDARDGRGARAPTRARSTAANVEFRLGEIEHLPVADGSVDVILSNCVINLSPDKRAVFREAFRVLTQAGGSRSPTSSRSGRSGGHPERSRGVQVRLWRRAHRRGRRDASRRRIPERSRRSEDQQRRPGARLVAWRRDARGVRTHPRDQAWRSRGPRVT